MKKPFSYWISTFFNAELKVGSRILVDKWNIYNQARPVLLAPPDYKPSELFIYGFRVKSLKTKEVEDVGKRPYSPPAY